MVYYIDVQPVKKKSRISMKRLRFWVYPTALILSLFMALSLSSGTDSTVATAILSPAELTAPAADALSEKVTEISAQTPVTFASPLDTAFISSRYGYRTNPVSGVYKLHGGLDLACSEGSSIYAPLGGRVITSTYCDSYGYYIIIDHNNSFQTLYAHCSELLKSEGETVEQGDIIALVGSTGNSTGPHLHIEVRIDGERTDPEPYFGGYFQ